MGQSAFLADPISSLQVETLEDTVSTIRQRGQDSVSVDSAARFCREHLPGRSGDESLGRLQGTCGLLVFAFFVTVIHIDIPGQTTFVL